MYYLRYFAIALIFFFSFEQSLFCADRLKMPDTIKAKFESVLPMIASRSGISTEQLRTKNFALWACIAQDVLDTDFPNTELFAFDAIVYSIFQNICMIPCKDLETLQRIVTTTSFSSPICVCIYFNYEIDRNEDRIISLSAGNRTFILPAAVKYVV